MKIEIHISDETVDKILTDAGCENPSAAQFDVMLELLAADAEMLYTDTMFDYNYTELLDDVRQKLAEVDGG